VGGFVHEGTNTEDGCICMGGGGGNCGNEGANVCGGWNACDGAEGWKGWCAGDTTAVEL
jgi:hypothetical protein